MFAHLLHVVRFLCVQGRDNVSVENDCTVENTFGTIIYSQFLFFIRNDAASYV